MNDSVAEKEYPIRFAGSELGAQRHICGFFRNPEEEYHLLLPFIKEGFERGEKAFHIVDPGERLAHLRQLGSAGIDVASVQEKGQLELRDWNQFYFPDGRFDETRTVAQWTAVLDGAVQNGYPRTRVIAHLEWSRDDADTLLRYESNFNRIPRNRDPVICIYDLSKHSAVFIMDIMRTHPMIIIGGILQMNPFYVPPDQFLRELDERQVALGESRSAANCCA
jgi:MEDS: MEthanogen/methylotroph, DcmR Sensory domain